VIENSLKNSKFIEEAIVIGNARRFVSAVIVPSFEALRQFATGRNIVNATDEELVNHPQVLELYSEEVARLCESFATFEQVKKFALLDSPLTIESGELTPSLKVKRRIVEEKFGDKIDAMYEE
jgi:long-chain acyl-CoA synthetase